MTYEQILTDVHKRVGIITLNQPEKLNALAATMRQELRQQIEAWNEDDAIGAIVLTGAGRAFCSGADISGFEQTIRAGSQTREPRSGHLEWIELVRQSKPFVCAINGVAVGEGATLTLPCDVRVASDQARLTFRFVRLGLTPEVGSTHYLVHLVGLGMAQELMLTGRFVSGEEAYRLGLVNHVYPAERMLDEAIALAQEIAGNPTWHLLATKRLVYQNYMEHDITKVTAQEDEFFRQAQASDAFREAITAFREKRPPRFH